MTAVATTKVIRLIIRCEKCGGVDEAHFAGDLYNLAFVTEYGRLLDGTHPGFTKPPGQGSVIGQCGKCHGRIRSTVL